MGKDVKIPYEALGSNTGSGRSAAGKLSLACVLESERSGAYPGCTAVPV